MTGNADKNKISRVMESIGLIVLVLGIAILLGIMSWTRYSHLQAVDAVAFALENACAGIFLAVTVLLGIYAVKQMIQEQATLGESPSPVRYRMADNSIPPSSSRARIAARGALQNRVGNTHSMLDRRSPVDPRDLPRCHHRHSHEHKPGRMVLPRCPARIPRSFIIFSPQPRS